MPTSDRYAKYRADQTTVWVTKTAATFMQKERTSPGEGTAVVLDRLLNELRKLRRSAGASAGGEAAAAGPARAAKRATTAAPATRRPAAGTGRGGATARGTGGARGTGATRGPAGRKSGARKSARGT